MRLLCQYTDPATGGAVAWDITPVADPRGSGYGLDAAWVHACHALHSLTVVMPVIENRHAICKADAYRRFKALPVDKKLGNPGTDTFFKDIWLPADPHYMASRIERDVVRDTIDALRMVYMPRLREQLSMENSGVRATPSSAAIDQRQWPTLQNPAAVPPPGHSG